MVKFLVMDVDGTLTDGKIYMSQLGENFKAFDVKDGCGIKDILPKYEIVPIVITARNSKILKLRCEELGIINCFQGIRNKYDKLIEIINDYSEKDEIKYSLKDCSYIGDDILDIQCMQPIKEAGGIVGCPADAVAEVKAIANFISNKEAGRGAVRSFINYLISEKKISLEEKIEKAISYVSKLDIYNMEVGRYNIDNDSYFMVQEYITRERAYCRLESHIRYIDVQWVIKGQEEIDSVSINGLQLKEKYNEDRDIIFWKEPTRMQRMVLSENSYVILYPEDAHMPCIAVGKSGKVRKIVIKINC